MDEQLLPPTQSPTASISSVDSNKQSLDFNAVVILVAMLCALLCALGLNSVIQCVARCTHRALTERLQWVSSRRLISGLKKKDMVALPTSTYEISASPTSSTSGCAICLVDFSDGDKIRVLPNCNHLFHVDCIDTWLLSHSSCPTCRHRLKSNDPVKSFEVVVSLL